LQFMSLKFLSSCLVALCIGLAATVTSGQESLPTKDSLFGAQHTAIEAAQMDQVDVLAPINFGLARVALADAEKEYDKARKLDKIREKLTQS